MTTVYPFSIRLGPVEITGFGLMMMVAFLMGGWLIDQELRRRRLNHDYAADIVVAAVIGGVLGAKLWFVGLTGDLDALVSRGGLVWYGGLFGGALAVLLNGWRLKVPARLTLDLAAPALAAAQALGRVGCWMVNDDYGRPTDLPIGVKFPQGLPPSTAGNMARMFGTEVPPDTPPATVLAVHPTQLYEVVLLLAAFTVLWRLRAHRHATGWLFGLYLVLAGIARFGAEFLRAKDDRFLAGFTVAQLTSVGLVLVGAAMLAEHRRGEPQPAGDYLVSGKR